MSTNKDTEEFKGLTDDVKLELLDIMAKLDEIGMGGNSPFRRDYEKLLAEITEKALLRDGR